jgi:hypothetical protein
MNCKRNIWNAMDDSWEIDPEGRVDIRRTSLIHRLRLAGMSQLIISYPMDRKEVHWGFYGTFLFGTVATFLPIFQHPH